ncbi:MAG: hypothetical protein H0U69_03545 [Trueperaceae bacterium]|nr:hypothetical protein [Trueperaceae bacterium]
MKTALTQLLLTLATFLPEAWRPTTRTLAAMVSAAKWHDDDARWTEVMVVINEALRDMQAAGQQTGSVTKAARVAADLKIGRELRRLGLVDVV